MCVESCVYSRVWIAVHGVVCTQVTGETAIQGMCS